MVRQQRVGNGPIRVIGVKEVVDQVRLVAQTKQHRDSPAPVTMELLDAAAS
jgi:hypothetical protein